MLRSIAPVEAPLQRMFVFENAAARAAGSLNEVLKVAVQPLASVTVTE